MSTYPTTDEILLDRARNGTNLQRCVDWAIGLLVAGSEADYVARLASQLPPFDHVAICNLRDKALLEVGVTDLSENAILTRHCAMLLRDAANGNADLARAIEIVKDMYLVYEFEQLREIYLLFHARTSLRDCSVQYYLKDFDRSNQESQTRKVIGRFVDRVLNNE